MILIRGMVLGAKAIDWTGAVFLINDVNGNHIDENRNVNSIMMKKELISRRRRKEEEPLFVTYIIIQLKFFSFTNPSVYGSQGQSARSASGVARVTGHAQGLSVAEP